MQICTPFVCSYCDQCRISLLIVWVVSDWTYTIFLFYRVFIMCCFCSLQKKMVGKFLTFCVNLLVRFFLYLNYTFFLKHLKIKIFSLYKINFKPFKGKRKKYCIYLFRCLAKYECFPVSDIRIIVSLFNEK